MSLLCGKLKNTELTRFFAEGIAGIKISGTTHLDE
jgi:hypothetical protein